jgi:uncharacterized protein YhhL (DUF1145 family)
MLPNTYATLLPSIYVSSGMIILLCGILMVVIQAKIFNKKREREVGERRLFVIGVFSIIAGLTLITLFIDQWTL